MVTMLEAVYIDLVATKSVVGIVPKPPFYPLFETMPTGEEGGVRVFKPNPEDDDEPPDGHGGGGDGGGKKLSWWRQARGSNYTLNTEIRSWL